MKKNTQGIVKKENKDVSEANNLIKMAIEKNVDVATMEKLLSMRKELKQEWAREKFFESLSQLQSELPVIKKTKVVKNRDGSRRYSYAPLDQILKQTKDLIKKHGFSYIFDTEIKDGMVNVFCRVTHKYGHTETSTFGVPVGQKIDTKMLTPDEYKRIISSMNDQQKMGSALTYAKRYTFCDAFGILTGDEDDDAQSASETETKPKLKPVVYRLKQEVSEKKKESQEEKQEEKKEEIKENQAPRGLSATPMQKNAILSLMKAKRISFDGNVEDLTYSEAKQLIVNSYKS